MYYFRREWPVWRNISKSHLAHFVISQMFGAMPVVNVSNWSLSDLHFKWASLRTIYAVFVSTILSVYSLFLLWKIFTDAVHLNMIGLSSLNEFVGWKKMLAEYFWFFSKRFILRIECAWIHQFFGIIDTLARADAAVANSRVVANFS